MWSPEYWDGGRWVWVDAQTGPDPAWGFDPLDVPRSTAFAPAAEVWTAHRRGEIDVSRYGVDPGLPPRGEWFVCAAERELARRYSADRRLHLGEHVLCFSPTGHHRTVDLRTRSDVAAV